MIDLARLLVMINGTGEYVCREYPGERKRIDIGDYFADYSFIRDTLGAKQPHVSLPDGT